MRANRILNIITGLFALPTLPVGLLTTNVGGCLVAVTFGLLLIPITIIWQFFVWPLLGLSWAWDKVPLLRIPLAIVGIPLAAMGTTYVALMPSMGDLGGRLNKFLICETWPFSLDYFRSRIKGIEPEYDRVVRIKQVIRGRAGGPEPDNSVWDGVVFDGGGRPSAENTGIPPESSMFDNLIALVSVHLTTALGNESKLVGELRPDVRGLPAASSSGVFGQLVGSRRTLMIRCQVVEFPVTEYEVGPDVIKFKIDQSDLKRLPRDNIP